MSRRDHAVLRLGALALLALVAWFPRGEAKRFGAASLTDGVAAATSMTTLTSASVDAPVEVASIGR